MPQGMPAVIQHLNLQGHILQAIANLVHIAGQCTMSPLQDLLATVRIAGPMPLQGQPIQMKAHHLAGLTVQAIPIIVEVIVLIPVQGGRLIRVAQVVLVVLDLEVRLEARAILLEEDGNIYNYQLKFHISQK